MKTGKTIVSVLVMAVVLSCSLFPVFATGTVNKTSSATIDGPNSNCHASIRATQYQGVATAGNGTSTSAYVGQSAIVVTANFYNEGDEPWYLDGVHVQLHDSSTTSHKLTDFDIIGGNLTVSQINTPYIFTIGGGENNSYNQGFVVAPHSKLSVAFRVSAFATSDSGNTQFSLDHVSTGAVTNTVGDYPYGLDVDFSPMIDYLESDVVPELLDQGITLDSILDAVTYSGSYAPFSAPTFASTTYTQSNNNVTAKLFVYRSRTIIVDHEIYYNSSSDDYNAGYSTYSDMNYVLTLYNDNDYDVYLTGSDPSVNFTVSIGFVVTDTGGDLVFFRDELNKVNVRNIVVPAKSYKHLLLVGRYYYTDSVPTNTVTVNSTLTINGSFSDHTPSSVTDMDTIHNQEQQWYQQNEAAIQSTGLANYSFTTNQISGIGTIASQFSSVWNALGDWTLIYIFVLTLSLATFIIRHRPSTKMQQRVSTMEREQFINKSVRAQRDSLYRHYWERYHK